MRKQNIHPDYRESAQAALRLRILKLINENGLTAAEYQVEFIAHNPKAVLPTVLNHRETVRIYQLTIIEYKNKLEKQINTNP